MSSFAEYNLDPAILKALKEINYHEPSPVQAETIPLIKGDHDLIALAETGSGKTAACAIPICDRVDISRKDIQALIIVPTRELALQYSMETRQIGKYKGVVSYSLFGGSDQGLQESKLQSGVHVLIATPGRLIDLIYQRVIDLTKVETLILDEADEMLSMGFIDDLEFIIGCLVHDHQTLLFSATMPKAIVHIAKTHMKNPREVKLLQQQTSPKSIDHKFVCCTFHEKERKLVEILRQVNPRQAIIFCQSRIHVEKICGLLRKKMKDVDFLHGGLNQDVRTIVTDKFRRGRIKLMVATDVASRGLDFSGVTHVIIYHMSPDIDLYVHRSGRCGRSGRKGEVITLLTDKEVGLGHRAMKKIGRKLEFYRA